MTTPGIGDTRTLPTTQINLFHKNPRRGDVEAIAGSLQAHGQFRPIVVNEGTHTGRPMETLAGNHTLKAIRLLAERNPDDPRWQQVECYVVDVDDDRASRIVLADNRTADLGDYDNDILLDVIGNLDDTLGLVGTGYDEGYIDALLGANEWETDEDEDQAEPTRLVDRFGVPPMTVLDARQGYWQERKRAWLALGIASEEGRKEQLTFQGAFNRWGNWYDVANMLRRENPDLTDNQIEEGYTHLLKPMVSNTSVFDPVLGELLYAWFSKEGDNVLDPWAGGSVRGVVATTLGRHYTGIDLSADQIAANERQWNDIHPRLPAMAARRDTVSDPTALTPIQEHDGVYVKRDDLWEHNGASGAKSRTMWRLITEHNPAGLITAGARISPQIERGALTAKAAGIPCRIHTGHGSDTPEIKTCRDAGAEVIQHQPARLTVIKSRVRDDAKQNPDWLTIPYGMNHPAYVDDVAAQVSNLPDTVDRLVVPVGSGMTLAGIIQGLEAEGWTIPILGVRVGGDPTEQLDKHAPTWRNYVTLTDAEQPYEDAVTDPYLGGLSLDPHYEAKCLPFLRPGDLLWVVGRRENTGHDLAPDQEATAAPEWITGDSREVLLTLPAESHDMIIGCPPYYDLEEYSDDPADLSNMSTEQFEQAMRDTLTAADSALRPDRFAAFIIGPVRDKRGHLRDMKRLMIESAPDGWHLVNDAVLVTSVGTAAARAARGFTATRTLARTHQDIVIFCKGDRKKATTRLGDVYLGELPDDPDHTD